MNRGPGDALAAIAGAARQLGAEGVAREADQTALRVSGNLFHVACVGQFKRGKSTLINGLVEASILPTGVVPVTSLITVVRFGKTAGASARYLDGREEEIPLSAVGDYVSEERNRGNQKKVAVVEVRVDAPLLASGMCLVDTPGLGSIFEESSEATRRFVPQIDVALLVIGADPPLSGEELSLAEAISRETSHCMVVLNKADRIPADDVAQAAAFARGTLEERLKKLVELFVVSALDRSGDWQKLRQHLAELAHTARTELLHAAGGRAVRRLGNALRREIEEHRRALVAPLEETERKLASLQRRVESAQRALDDLAFLFASEQQKLSRQFGAARDRFLNGARAVPVTEDDARKIARAAIEAWLLQIEPEGERMFASASARFAALLDDLGAAEELDTHLARRRFYFTALPELTGHSWFRRGDAREYLRRLLETNSARVMNDLIDRVVESRRRLEAEVASSLREILASAERAARSARAAQENGRERVGEELARLDALAAETENDR